MDQDETNDVVPAGNPSDSNPEEPTAAHFREAARLAAARVRAALASKPEEDVGEPQESPPEPGDFEDAARTHANALSGHAQDARHEEPEPEPMPEPTPEPTPEPMPEQATEQVTEPAPEPTPDPEPLTTGKSSSKSSRSDALAEIDERLELGARMLRAFESQIQRLERSARTAETAQEALGAIPDPSEMEEAVAGFEHRVMESIGQAEGALGNLQEAAERSNSTAEALAGGLETANTVKSLLETTLHTLAEEADARSADVKRTLAQAEAALETMNQQLKRAEEIEHAVGARLTRAQGAVDQLEHASEAALGSIREQVARELTAIGTALLEHAPTDTAAPRTFEPPLIEVESMSEQKGEAITEPIEAPPAGQQISRGTLSIDEATIKRQADGD